MNLAQRAILRMFALWLITLILLPFTAPFATFDLDHSDGQSSHDWLAKDKTDSDEKVVAQPELTAGPPALNIVAVSFAVPDTQYEERPLLLTPLRV